MAKIGSILQEARLSRGLTLDKIADETNISVRFLSKLENDDFTGFPGEPYIIGFIRNYVEYLGMDSEAMVARYRQKEAAPASAPKGSEVEEEKRAPEALAFVPDAKASEPAQNQPAAEVSKSKGKKGKSAGTGKATSAIRTDNAADMAVSNDIKKTPNSDAAAGEKKPVEPQIPENTQEFPQTQAVVNQPRHPPLRHLVLGLLAFLIVGAAVLWIFLGGAFENSGKGREAAQPIEYKVEGADFQKRLYPGDSLLIPFNEDVYRVSLSDIHETVNLETPFGTQELRLGEAAELDPDKNDLPDIALVVEDFQKDKPSSGALLKVEFIITASLDSNGPGEVTIPQGPVQQSTIAQIPSEIPVLRSTRGPYPFVVQVNFRGSCLFRYEADRKEWVEKYYSKGESISINVTNALNIWTSNAQAVKLTVQAAGGRSVDLEVGAPGEIAVKRLSWSKTDSSTWTLTSSELD